jgi:hypothetical protein
MTESVQVGTILIEQRPPMAQALGLQVSLTQLTGE